MNKIILITRPCYDDATNYLYYYAGLIIKEIENKGVPVLDLKNPRLTQQKLIGMLKSKDPFFIFFNGHGNESTIYGDKIKGEEEVLIEENKNHALLDKKLVYARACSAAKSLGKACKGGCFIGYNVPFSFWINQEWVAKPSNDNTAKLFLEPSNRIVQALLKGNTAQEAVNKSNDMTKKNILKLLKEKKEPGAVASIMLLWSNMQGLEICGHNGLRF